MRTKINFERHNEIKAVNVFKLAIADIKTRQLQKRRSFSRRGYFFLLNYAGVQQHTRTIWGIVSRALDQGQT